MPVGNDAAPELMPTPEQRKYMIDRIRYLRSTEGDIPFYPMDFQNDGEFVGGCIAGGRNYFHINSAGDAEPCVFIHYSNANIHDQSILEILHSPLFMAYHNGQPFNKQSPAPLPDAGEPRDCCSKMVQRDRRPHHRPAVAGERRAPVREVQELRCQLAAHGRRDLVPYQDPARAVTRTIRTGSPRSPLKSNQRQTS